jgi:hypothetical protein
VISMTVATKARLRIVPLRLYRRDGTHETSSSAGGRSSVPSTVQGSRSEIRPSMSAD